MPYRYSQLDKDNTEWFKNDLKPCTLCGIHLRAGKMRGIYPVHRVRISNYRNCGEKRERKVHDFGTGLLRLS